MYNCIPLGLYYIKNNPRNRYTYREYIIYNSSQTSEIKIIKYEKYEKYEKCR